MDIDYEQLKGQNPLHQFPRSKSATSPQHKRQSVTSCRGQNEVRCACCVASFPKFHYSDLLPTCYRETCVMDFGHKWWL